MGFRIGAITILISLLLVVQPLQSTVVLLPQSRLLPLRGTVPPTKDGTGRKSERAPLLSETVTFLNPTSMGATEPARTEKTSLKKEGPWQAKPEPEPEPAMTYQPVIGVLSQPGYADSQRVRDRFNATRENNFANLSFFAASYVKFVEAGGARVVPLIYNEPWRHMRKKLRLINGLLLPGGSADKSGAFFRTVRRLVRAAMRMNDEGDYFPIYAECLSFEMLAIFLSNGGRSVLQSFRANQPSTLLFAHHEAKRSNMFGWMPRELVDRMEREELAMEHHSYGLSPQTFRSDRGLSTFFRILTTSFDLDGKEYVSTMEGRKYPITALQWHPEKNAFEWGNPLFPHTPDAIQITTAAGAFFVNEARKNQHLIANRKALNKLIIYNYDPVFTGLEGNFHYEQAYVFQCHNASDTVCLLPHF